MALLRWSVGRLFVPTFSRRLNQRVATYSTQEGTVVYFENFHMHCYSFNRRRLWAEANWCRKERKRCIDAEYYGKRDKEISRKYTEISVV